MTENNESGTWDDSQVSEEKAKRKPRRSASQLARDRRLIAGHYLKGWLQADIAKEVDLSQSTVSNDLKALQREWLKSALIDVNEHKARELGKVDHLERTYWDAWERSCEDAETTTHKTKGVVKRKQNEDGTFVAERPAESIKTSQVRNGDPRFLTGVQWCIERRCKILGVDAPVEQRHTGNVNVFQYTGNIPEEGF